MRTESLITVGDILKRGTPQGDWEQSVIFRDKWNTLHPSVPCKLKENPHDFGSYYSIEVSEKLFYQNCEPNEEFPDGIETESSRVAEELGLDI